MWASGLDCELAKKGGRLSGSQSTAAGQKQVFLALVRMSEEAEMPQANINSLLVELQKTYPAEWTKEQMLQALRVLEQEGKLLLQERTQTATLL